MVSKHCCSKGLGGREQFLRHHGICLELRLRGTCVLGPQLQPHLLESVLNGSSNEVGLLLLKPQHRGRHQVPRQLPAADSSQSPFPSHSTHS